MANGSCCWVLTPAIPNKQATYCGLRTGYTLPVDDDGNRVRRYNNFCPEHQQRADAQDNDPDWDFT